MMTAKEYFENAKDLGKSIKKAQSELMQQTSALYSGKGVRYCDNESKQATRGNSTEAAYLSMLDYSDKLDNKKLEYSEAMHTIKKLINLLGVESHREVLTKRYVSNKPWRKIAKETNYSKSHCYRIASDAFEILDVKYFSKR